MSCRGSTPDGWDDALRAAFLLTGDAGAAEELAVAALVRSRRRWPARTDPRRAALTLPSSPVGRLRARAGRRPEPGDPFLRAYLALAPGARALLVLRVADGLDAAGAAAVLGADPAPVAAGTVAALDALRGAVDVPVPVVPGGVGAAPAIELDLGEMTPRPLPAGRGGGPTAGDDAGVDPSDPAVGRLAALFEGLAGQLPRTPDPAGRVERAAARNRSRRRGALAVTAALAVVLAVGGTLLAREHARVEAQRARADRDRALQELLHPVVGGGDVSTWPTRGSHAGDAALLAEVRRRAGSDQSLPFVGRVGDLDVALVVGGSADRARLRVLHGPAGAPPTAWDEDDGVPGGDGDTPTVSAAVRDAAGVVHLVVVTLSTGVSAAYSTGPTLADDGTASRRYLALDLDDGVGTALARGEPRRFALRVGPTGGDPHIGGVDVTAPGLTPDTAFPTALPMPVRAVPSCSGLFGPDDAHALADQALDKAGLAPDDVAGIRQLWCHRGGNRAQLALALTARHGPDVQCFEEATTTGETTGFTQLCWPVARGEGARAGFVAPRIGDVEPSDPPGLTAWAPGAARLEVLSPFDPGRPVLTVPVGPGGYARLVLPAGQASTGDNGDDVLLERDAGGHEIGRLRARGPVGGDPWGEFADGPVVTAVGGAPGTA